MVDNADAVRNDNHDERVAVVALEYIYIGVFLRPGISVRGVKSLWWLRRKGCKQRRNFFEIQPRRLASTAREYRDKFTGLRAGLAPWRSLGVTRLLLRDSEVRESRAIAAEDEVNDGKGRQRRDASGSYRWRLVSLVRTSVASGQPARCDDQNREEAKQSKPGNAALSSHRSMGSP